MWVEFVVGSRPCSEGGFSGFSGVPSSTKTLQKFQFDQYRGPEFRPAEADVASSLEFVYVGVSNVC